MRKPRLIPLGGALAALVILAASRSLAHDFWLVPEFFAVPAGWHIHVRASTGGDFPESTAALTPDRVVSARLVGAGGSHGIDRMHRIGNSLALEAAPPAEGQWWVAMEVKPRRIDLTAEEFNEYLAHDGLPQVLEIRRSRGELDLPGRERYSRGAKALVHVGSGASDCWDLVLGHAIELVPLVNPETLHPGDTLGVRLLFRGQPVSGAIVSAGYAGQPGPGHTSQDSTDAAGVARLAIPSTGVWYVRTIHMIEGPVEADFDWESFWATLTFEVAGE
jgi:hypothetical protein